jgi:type IV fimbrial biogenesis protein FimT
MCKYSGFTIIELMVVIAIVAILAAVAGPSWTESMARRSLEGVANELSADLQYAKSQAASINSNVSLTTSLHGYTVSSATTTFKTIVLDSTVSLTDAVTATFEPLRALSNTTASITIAHSKTSTRLRVNTDVMGRIQICSPNASLGGYIPC